MHNYKKSSTNFFGRNILKTAALSSLLVFSNAYATGLGKLTVLSSLGQPLKAEIELTSANKDEIASLVPKISSVETFKQANIEFNPALLSLRFAVVSKGNGYVIKVTSTQPMNEPWVDFLLEMKADGGRLVREYTFLLDPADLNTSQSAQVANPTPLISNVRPNSSLSNNNSSQRDDSSVVKKTELVKKTSKSAETISNQDSAGGEYRVRSGDTLMQIASMQLNGISLDQMLVGIYQANPDAFVGQNMNRLKAGQVLKIPNSNDISSNSRSEAQSIIRAHTADFNAYRNKLAGRVALAPKSSDSIKNTSSNAITSKIKEQPNKVNESLDKLKLSKVDRSTSGVAKKSNASSDEDRIAKEKALQEANARVKELEKNVSDLNKLLAVPSKTNTVKDAAVHKSAEKPIETKATTATPIVSKVESPSPVKTASAVNSEHASIPVASSNAHASSKNSASRPKKPLPPPVVAESNWLDSTYIMPISVALLALLAGLGFYFNRKKRESHQFEDSILTGSSLKANSMFGSTGGQSVDTNNSVFNSNFAPSASQLDANEVDPVAEADVYIAYGRDTQAEEILKEALRTQPERHAVRIKLLEIYFARKDQKSFDLLAGELYGMTRGEGDDWSQAASMGLSLDPSNPLYAGASPQSEAYLPGLSLPTQPLEDIDANELLEGSLSPDMLDSISIIDLASGHSESSTDSIDSIEDGNSSQKIQDDSFDMDGLDFDLDISDDDSELDQNIPTIPDLSISTTSKIAEVEENIPTIDFGSIDFDLGNTESDVVSDLVQDLSDEIDTSLDLMPESALSLSSETFEMQSNPAIEIEPKADEIPSIDLTNLEFDLDVESVESAKEDSESKPAYNAEMATKLDLAVAYQEIGDREGARVLLEEVIKGGSSEQIDQAKEMLKQIS